VIALRKLIVIVAAVGALAASVPAAEAVEWKRCGSNTGEGWTYGPTTGAGVFNVRARKVSCRKARYIVMTHGRWDSTHSDGHDQIQWWRGPWTCNYRSTGYESGRLWCLAPYGRRIKWTTGA
jgi:hypothetical protein